MHNHAVPPEAIYNHQDHVCVVDHVSESDYDMLDMTTCDEDVSDQPVKGQQQEIRPSVE